MKPDNEDAQREPEAVPVPVEIAFTAAEADEMIFFWSEAND